MNGVIKSIGAGDNGWSIEDYSREIGKNPRCADAYNNRGVLYYEIGKYDQALTDFKESMRLSQKSETGDYNCGLAYFSCQLYDEAIESLNKAIMVFNGLVVDSKAFIHILSATYFYCGLAHYNKGEHEQAIKNLQEADRLEPNNQEIVQALKDVQKELDN